MTQTTTLWFSIPGDPKLSGCSGNQIRAKVEGAKNHQLVSSYTALATYNVRWLATVQKVTELEEQLNVINWDVLVLSEVRRKGENELFLNQDKYYTLEEEKIVHSEQ